MIDTLLVSVILDTVRHLIKTNFLHMFTFKLNEAEPSLPPETVINGFSRQGIEGATLAWAKHHKPELNADELLKKGEPQLQAVEAQEAPDAQELHRAFREEQIAKADRMAKETSPLLPEDKDKWTAENESINEKLSRGVL